VSISEGQTIGNYRILRQIGTGGMGAVYLAEHPLIGKKVALKVIHQELSRNREVIGRFFNEARAVNRIGHEHIVEIHDFGQSPEGHYFFLMEYLEGQSLAQVLGAERVLDVQRALHIAAQIADALGAAHACAIIHRDLKPDNVMLVSRLGDPDFVKILDFGLAKMFEGGAVANLTAQGVVLGTPQYMSPEACESKRDIDHRTDIYALGILLFQMLCGQVPFDGNTMGEVLVKQVTHAPPAPRALNPHIPPSVEQIILRCLAKTPDARFPMMNTLREALLDPDRYLASSPPVVPAALTRSSAQAQTLFVDAAGPVVPAVPKPQPLGLAQTAPVPSIGRSSGPALALQPPPPSLVPGASDAKTVYAAGAGTPAVGRSTGPQPAIGDDPSRRASMPGMQLPQHAQNQTMVIGTPAGYKDRPPRRLSPTVIAVLVALIAAGGGVAIALMMRKGAAGGGPGAVPATVAIDASSPAVVTADAAAAAGGSSFDAAPSRAVAPQRVTVRIESEPPGAEVWFDGAQHGVTPATIDVVPGAAEHALILRLAEYKEKNKAVTITDAQTIRLELEKAPREAPSDRTTGHRSGKGARKGVTPKTSGGDEDKDLMKPPWMK